MIQVANPDDDYTQGPSVVFDVPAALPVKRSFPWWILAVVAALLIVGGGLGWYFGLRTQAIPDVKGLSIGAATTTLTDAGFKTGTIIPAPDPAITNGLVIKTDPAAGTRQRPGTTVNLQVSSGPGTPTPTAISPTPTALPAGHIFILAYQQGSKRAETFTIDPDGSNQVRLGSFLLDPAATVSPSDFVWAPDGKNFAFISYRNGNPQLFARPADGSTEVQLTSNPGSNAGPVWSPDSNRLAFISNDDVYSLKASNGSDQIRLTNNQTYNFGITWAPDGKSLVFASFYHLDGNNELFRVNANGSNLTRLTTTPNNEYNAAWAPDGKRLACAASSQSWQEIFTLKPDGTDLTRLTNLGSTSSSPVWSPDSKKIAFIVYQNNINTLYVVDAAGGPPVQLTNLTGNSSRPTWSPDNTRLVFIYDDGGKNGIYVLNTTTPGEPLQLIQNNEPTVYALAWIP
jgi:TolB protein